MPPASMQQTFQVYRENHARLDPIDPISDRAREKISLSQIANVSHDATNAKLTRLSTTSLRPDFFKNFAAVNASMAPVPFESICL